MPLTNRTKRVIFLYPQPFSWIELDINIPVVNDKTSKVAN